MLIIADYELVLPFDAAIRHAVTVVFLVALSSTRVSCD